jgi:hypothetical protein
MKVELDVEPTGASSAIGNSQSRRDSSPKSKWSLQFDVAFRQGQTTHPVSSIVLKLLRCVVIIILQSAVDRDQRVKRTRGIVLCTLGTFETPIHHRSRPSFVANICDYLLAEF